MHAADLAQAVAEFGKALGWALHQEHLQALIVLKEDVLGGDDLLEKIALCLGQSLADATALGDADGTAEALAGEAAEGAALVGVVVAGAALCPL